MTSDSGSLKVIENGTSW